ncbi:MAG TPA: hypothetical protein VHX38_02190 [Pseudonocardiaceae bacterium]|nr:hypothetical protein [Pseudonocardiaceae bacterium]
MDDISQVAAQGDGYPMYDNDRLGCCVWAMVGHAIQVQTLLGLRSEVEVTAPALIKGYSDVTGYDPHQERPDGSNPTDQGTNMADAMSYWRKTGIAKPDGTKDKILAYAEVDHTDRELVADCIELFGPGMQAVLFPDAAMDQFNNGEEWAVVPGPEPDEGHAILKAQYALTGDPSAPTAMSSQDVTWGAVQKVSDGWDQKYTDQLFFVITRDWFAANGVDPNGEAAGALGEEFAVMTGEPNPFPEPVPTPAPPAPSPTPVPVPVPPTPAPTPDVHMDSADVTLAQALRPWLNERHVGANEKAVRAVDAWLKTKQAGT